jgi:hypothetical protein
MFFLPNISDVGTDEGDWPGGFVALHPLAAKFRCDEEDAEGTFCALNNLIAAR